MRERPAEPLVHSDELECVRETVRRMRTGAPTAPVDVDAVRRRVARLLHRQRPVLP